VWTESRQSKGGHMITTQLREIFSRFGLGLRARIVSFL
jgi:hypothetical protein